MKQQLVLIENPPEWRIDEPTRELGRRGLAEARQALETAHRWLPTDESRSAA